MEKAGFYRKRQKEGHIVLCRDKPFAEVIVPNHKNLDKGTLRAITGRLGRGRIYGIIAE